LPIIALIVAILALAVALAQGQPADPPVEIPHVTLQWDPVVHPDLGGYKLYWGLKSGYPDGHVPGPPPEGVPRDYSSFTGVDVSNVTTYTFYNLDLKKKHYLVVTAYSVPRGDPPKVEESDYSNEVFTRGSLNFFNLRVPNP
jgi:hypothetical protein